MTDLEFDILDELYFVTSYSDLKEQTGFSDADLRKGLQKLWEKGWLRGYASISKEAHLQAIDWEKEFVNYYYLASKEGLMAHNGKE